MRASVSANREGMDTLRGGDEDVPGTAHWPRRTSRVICRWQAEILSPSKHQTRLRMSCVSESASSSPPAHPALTASFSSLVIWRARSSLCRRSCSRTSARPAAVRLPMLRRPCASRRNRAQSWRARALLRRSAQQGLQDWQVDGRAEDEDARGARTRRRHQARWGAAWQPQPRFRVRRRSRRMAARTTRAHSPAASSSSTRR